MRSVAITVIYVHNFNCLFINIIVNVFISEVLPIKTQTIFRKNASITRIKLKLRLP